MSTVGCSCGFRAGLTVNKRGILRKYLVSHLRKHNDKRIIGRYAVNSNDLSSSNRSVRLVR